LDLGGLDGFCLHRVSLPLPLSAWLLLGGKRGILVSTDAAIMRIEGALLLAEQTDDEIADIDNVDRVVACLSTEVGWESAQVRRRGGAGEPTEEEMQAVKEMKEPERKAAKLEAKKMAAVGAEEAPMLLLEHARMRFAGPKPQAHDVEQVGSWRPNADGWGQRAERPGRQRRGRQCGAADDPPGSEAKANNYASGERKRGQTRSPFGQRQKAGGDGPTKQKEEEQKAMEKVLSFRSFATKERRQAQ
jgi:hypothetical protein